MIFSRRCFVFLCEFTGDHAAMKFVYGLLGEVLPTGDVDGFKPAFFPPAPRRNWCHPDPLQPL